MNEELFRKFYEYRLKARGVLKSAYFRLLSVVLTGALLTGELFQYAFLLTQEGKIDRIYIMFLQRPLLNYTWEQWLSMRMYLAIGAGVMLLLWFLFFNVLNYGIVNSFRADGSFGIVFRGFRENYLQIVKTKALADISVALRTLLLVVPGIKERYSYYFLDYVLFDHPEWNTDETLEYVKSKAEGHRMDYFRFDLLFFGWYIAAYYLGPYIFGLGLPLVRPYILESKWIYYYDLVQERENAEMEAEYAYQAALDAQVENEQSAEKGENEDSFPGK